MDIGGGIYELAGKTNPPRDTRECRDFLFGSRLQPMKRPDLFIRAAILFLERHPDHEGVFRLVCYGWDRTYVDGLKSLVPEPMAHRIMFVENATGKERLQYIDNAIVVIPSSYESLCLFAFEAALAGRKVILNQTVPCFGNDFRWHDGKNCLLFDGSVESLTDAMEQAISWQPSSFVAVAPDLPYWLGNLNLPLSSKATAEAQSVETAVLCYGVQAPPEFRRHYDGACQVARELKAAGEPHRIVFQLPYGAFADDGPEVALIQEQGWQLVISSGVRECPQMFGKRVASLGTAAVLLFPFGHDVAPGFAVDAIRVMRANPALALVSGHIEIVDSGTGRSDYIRVYSGEAPSTALLSSRIAAPLCLLKAEVVQRIGFDPLAGFAWFEVFARTCALRGEPMLIMPVLAGALDGLLRHRPENSKRISAGILDQLGIASGWQARLLSLDPVQVGSDADNRPLVYDEDKMRKVFRINPSGQPRSWEPVGWNYEGHGVLVHPLDGEITIAELAGPYRRVSKLTAQVRNMRHDNAGAEVAIALARSQVDVDDVRKALEKEGSNDSLVVSKWTIIEPGATLKLAITCYSVSRGHDKILLISRPRPGCSDSNGIVVFNEIELHFNNLSIG